MLRGRDPWHSKDVIKGVMWEAGAGIPRDSNQTKFTQRKSWTRVLIDTDMMCVGLRDGSEPPGISGNH